MNGVKLPAGGATSTWLNSDSWKLRRMPWDYARFLDYAAGRLFLHKVGGGYIFIHRLLQFYFTAL